MNTVDRPRYRARLARWAGKPLIKVVTGQRRVGKSSLLALLVDERRADPASGPTVWVPMESIESRSIATGDDLVARVLAEAPRGPATVVVDEVQEIAGFERALRSLAADDRLDLYVSGSNAELLSGEIASRFGGRAVTIEILPLSYDEFLTFHRMPDDAAALAAFLRYGGLPFLRHLSLTDDVVFEYLGGVAKTAILNDVVARHAIRSVDLLERTARFLADNVGSPVSAHSIARYLKSQRSTAAVATILDYLSFLEQAYLVRRVPRADIGGKRLLEVAEKHYFEDLGIRAAILGSPPADPARTIESAVHHRLLVDGWRVATGSLGPREVDFVCDRGADRLYVQATYLMADPATREREFGTLLAIQDNHPKLVVSMDPLTADERGVKHRSLQDFLRVGA